MPRQQNQQSRKPSPTPAVRPYVPPPKIWHASPPTTLQPSVWDSVKQGIGFGAGSEIGHRMMGSLLAPNTPILPSKNHTPHYFESEHYKPCLEANPQFPDVCKPFQSKEKSPWTLCMVENFYRSELCEGEKQNSTK